jgi:lambda family phage minor tail protein L
VSDHLQLRDLGPEIHLYDLDLTMFGEGTFHWTPADTGDPGASVQFDGTTYLSFPVHVSAYQASTTGAPSRPTLIVPNEDGLFTPLVRDNWDLRGAILRHRVTYAKFLDDGDDPDPEAVFMDNEWAIVRKTSARKSRLAFELATPIAMAGSTIPSELALQDGCQAVYRKWDPVANAFDYTGATCGYTGTQYVKADGTTTNDPALDSCPKLWRHCRHQQTFTACPSMARFRIR